MAWKEIKGYEGKYEISDEGQIKSVARTIIFGSRNSRLDVPDKIKSCNSRNNGGYVTLNLCDKKKKSFMLHRLVAQHFLEPVEGKTHVNHIDGNKENNHVSNLEWVTHSENHIHAAATGLKACGQDSPKSKLSAEQVREIRRLHGSNGETYASLGKRFNIGWSAIRNIILGHTWKQLL